MAARKNLLHTELVRERIRTSQLVNALSNHVLGKRKMVATQVAAALGLLRKTIPDIQTIEHLGEVQHVVHQVLAAPLTEEQWQAQHGSERETLNG